MFVDPAAEDPNVHIGFREEFAYDRSDRGEATCDELDLNRPPLVERRADRIEHRRRLQQVVAVLHRRRGAEVRKLVAAAMRMVATGVLDEDAHVELLEGDLVEVSPQAPEHAARHTALRDLLIREYAGTGHVRDQCPLVASRISLPEPDLAVIRGSSRDYVARHPTRADAILVIEVAITSQRLDRRKIGIYAAAGVAEHWLVDLPRGTLDRFATPGPDGYATHVVLEMDDSVGLPGLAAAHRLREML